MRQNTRAAGRRARDLLDLGLAIDREQAHAERMGARDVALLLDRVAEGDAIRRGAGREHHLDLGDRGGVEAGAELRPAATAPPAPGWPSRRRTRACRAAPSRRSCSCRARRRGRRRGRARRRAGSRRLRRKSRMRSVMALSSHKAQRAATAAGLQFRRRSRPASAGEETARRRAMETRTTRRALHPTMLPWIGAGDPVPHGRQGWTSLFGVDLWRADETKEARSVVALSRVPR